MQRSNAVIANEAFKALSYRSGSLTLKDLRNAVMCHTRLSSEEAVRALMQLVEDGRLIPDPLRAYCYTVSREPLNIWGRVSYSLNKLIALDPLLYDELIKTFKDAPNFEKLTIRPEGLTPGRWDAFRRQMRYYVELVKRSGGVQSFKAKEQGTVYNFIEGVLPAFSLYDSKRRLERADVTLSGENHFFNEPRWPLVIGFPVEVNYDKEAKAYSFTPVFYLTLSSDVLWSRAHPYLYRNYDASVKSPIQLNGAWADSHRPDGKSTETIARFNEFLQECGLRQRGAFTEQPLSEYLDEGVAPAALKRQGWADHLEILRRYFGALVFEPLSEYRLRSAKSLQEESLLSDCDGKIVNAAVVGLQKGSPFTQSLIRELKFISDPSRVSDTDLEDTALRWFFADPLPSDLVAAQEGVPYTYVCSDPEFPN